MCLNEQYAGIGNHRNRNRYVFKCARRENLVAPISATTSREAVSTQGVNTLEESAHFADGSLAHGWSALHVVAQGQRGRDDEAALRRERAVRSYY